MKGAPKYRNKIPIFLEYECCSTIINKQIRHALLSAQLNLDTSSMTQPTLGSSDVSMCKMLSSYSNKQFYSEQQYFTLY